MTKNPVDVAIVASAFSSPIWLEYFNVWGGSALILLGIVVSVMRIINWFQERKYDGKDRRVR